MRILFSIGSFGFLRNFQSTVRLLASRGHRIHVLTERGDTVDGQVLADTLAAEYPGAVTTGVLPTARHRLWYAFGTALRGSRDYWRYLDPRWAHAPKLRARAAAAAPAVARGLPRVPGLGNASALAAMAAAFRHVDRLLPPAPEVAKAIDAFEPDLLLITPLLYLGSYQVAHVRAARQRGIPSVVGIGSWDHLTTKGLLHEIPDRVLVWNEAQADEAIALHGVPRNRIVVTGSQAYDHWFTMTPSTDRDRYCARLGLDASTPILLYLCSSPFIAPYEVGFVRRWVAGIRASTEPRVRDAGLLIRPHPQNATQWKDVDLSAEFPNVAVYPRAGANPFGGNARADYFDAMFHAEAVVGVNTSGMIESGIVGRPVLTVQDDEFGATQDGTLHFQHLKNVEGGLLTTARTIDEHVRQLREVIEDPAGARARARAFIGAFIRPLGFEQPATPLVVAAIEACGASAAVPARTIGAGTHVARALLAPMALLIAAAAMPPARRRSIVLQWSRPVGLAWRRARSLTIYGWRFGRRMPTRAWRTSAQLGRWLIVRPMRWTKRTLKMALHARLTRRKGTPDQAS